MTPYRHRSVIEQRRDDVQRIDSMTVKVTRVSGYVLISHIDTNVAESSVDIPFPVVFTEKPVFTYGSELDVNHRPTAGSFPKLSATVVGWETVGAITGVTDGRFLSATVTVVSEGDIGQRIWLHYSFEGKAIRNPLNKLDDSDL